MAGFTLLALLLTIGMCLNPFNCLFRTDIILLWKTFLNILIAPFGLVQFRHFFLTDILTSLVQSLRDIGFIVCFFTNSFWLRSEEPSVEKCAHLENYIVAISFLPCWIRFAQCFKKYYNDPKRDIKTLYNAGKYFIVLMVQVANAIKVKTRTRSALNFFIVISSISTFLSYCWDLYMDWGLLRS